MTDLHTTAVSPAPTTTRNQLGVAAFIIGAASFVISRGIGLATPFVVSSGGASYALISTLGLFNTVLSFVLGLTALVLGIIVLVKRGAPKGFAAAGAALGGAELFGAVLGFGQTITFNLLG